MFSHAVVISYSYILHWRNLTKARKPSLKKSSLRAEIWTRFVSWGRGLFYSPVTNRSRFSLTGVLTSLRAESPCNHCLIPGKSSRFFLLQSAQTSCVAHTAVGLIGESVDLERETWPKLEADHNFMKCRDEESVELKRLYDIRKDHYTFIYNKYSPYLGPGVA
jgi:hypothetical protein